MELTPHPPAAATAFCPVCGASLSPSACGTCPLTVLSGCGPTPGHCPECGWCSPPETAFSRFVRRLFGRSDS